MRRAFAAAFFVLYVAGCTTGPWHDPMGVMLDREAGYSQRRAAGDQARRQIPRDPRRIEALQKILWQRGYPFWQKRQAVDDLIAYDERAFRDALLRRFGMLRNRQTIEYIFQIVSKQQWRDFTRVAVRNYERIVHGVADKDRTERLVIQNLNPDKTLEQVVFEVFANDEDAMTYKEQVAAWQLLVRLTGHKRLIEMIKAAPAKTPLVIDMQAGASELGVLPRHREDVLWLQYLRDPSRRGFWDRAAAVVRRLSDEQKDDLQLRHLPVLVQLDTTQLASSRRQLIAKIDPALRQADRYMIGPTYDGPMRDWPQDFFHYVDRLCWGDLVTIDMLMLAVHAPAVARKLFTQGDRDRSDPSTEYGGIIERTDEQFAARPYEPRYRKHDLKFIPSDKMIKQLYTSLAHYHFHAQRYKNRNYSGPGEGDLRLADRLGMNFLVFTFIDHDRLNVDYCQRGRIVIDLGTIRR